MPRREEFGKFISWSIPIFSGNAVSKRVNWEIRNQRIKNRSGYLVHREVIETMKVVLGLGYSVIVTYIIEWEVLEDYLLPLKKSGLQPVLEFCFRRERSVLTGIFYGRGGLPDQNLSINGMNSRYGLVQKCQEVS